MGNENSHTHPIPNGTPGGYATSNPNTPTSVANHTHNYTSWAAAANTSAGTSHTHSNNSLSAAQADARHYHYLNQAATSNDGYHTHNFTNAPLYYRGLTMFSKNASTGAIEGHPIGSMFQSQAFTATQLYTNVPDTTTTTIGNIQFSYIATYP